MGEADHNKHISLEKKMSYTEEIITQHGLCQWRKIQHWEN